MPGYNLSVDAGQDIEKIADYAIRHFGVAKARDYRDGLQSCLTTLVQSPRIGHIAIASVPTVRRFSYQESVIFYQSDKGGIQIVRVLHKSMGVTRHL